MTTPPQHARTLCVCSVRRSSLRTFPVPVPRIFLRYSNQPYSRPHYHTTPTPTPRRHITHCTCHYLPTTTTNNRHYRRNAVQSNNTNPRPSASELPSPPSLNGIIPTGSLVKQLLRTLFSILHQYQHQNSRLYSRHNRSRPSRTFVFVRITHTRVVCLTSAPRHHLRGLRKETTTTHDIRYTKQRLVPRFDPSTQHGKVAILRARRQYSFVRVKHPDLPDPHLARRVCYEPLHLGR